MRTEFCGHFVADIFCGLFCGVDGFMRAEFCEHFLWRVFLRMFLETVFADSFLRTVFDNVRTEFSGFLWRFFLRTDSLANQKSIV